ncbi:hypothetical protein A2J01_26875 [Rhodococcus sp. EPR-134]|nr:hypothetical protein A2J01_26875 [Rhodococcus sp. EPR-134]
MFASMRLYTAEMRSALNRLSLGVSAESGGSESHRLWLDRFHNCPSLTGIAAGVTFGMTVGDVVGTAPGDVGATSVKLPARSTA